MALNKGFNDEIKALVAEPIQGVPVNTTYDTVLATQGKNQDFPFRLFASATPDALLNISAAEVTMGDGGGRSVGPQNDFVVSTVATTINMQNGAVTGGTVKYNGVTLALPTSAVTGRYRRMVLSSQSDGSITVNFGNEFTSLSLLNGDVTQNPGALLSAIGGTGMGWVDLQSTSTGGAYKTADSATSVIENFNGTGIRINRFGAGVGGGGGSDSTFKFSSFSATGGTLKGAIGMVEGFGMLALGSGTTSLTAGVDTAVNLNNVLTASGLTALGTINSAAAVLLSLYVDLNTLSTAVTLTDTKRLVFVFGESNLKFFNVSDPLTIAPGRYVFLDQVLIPQTVSSWATATGYNKPSRIHNTLAAIYAQPERFSQQITSGTGTQTLTHNLSAEPAVVLAYYFDGTNKNRIDDQNVVIDKSATSIKVNTDAYDVTGGKYVEIQAINFPTFKNVASASRTFTSAWFANSATTTVPHGLNDQDDIRGYEVQEWDVTNSRYRNIDRSAVVINFDATNFYLDWTSVPFTSGGGATLKYRVVAGGAPLPWAFPQGYLGYTKYVGNGPGSFASMTAALAGAASGDYIWINRSTVETADLVIPAGVKVAQAPGTTVVMSGSLTNGVRFTGAKAQWTDMNVQLNPTGTQAKGVSIEAADCWVTGWLELNTAQTLTDVLNITSGGSRNKVELSFKKTLGTVTTAGGITNADGASNPNVWGDVP